MPVPVVPAFVLRRRTPCAAEMDQRLTGGDSHVRISIDEEQANDVWDWAI